ncbi:MAG TPA: glycosyltransferase [Bacteroidota bacterium]|nr:glycosyltransferase [Bacteroidota bacterium]
MEPRPLPSDTPAFSIIVPTLNEEKLLAGMLAQFTADRRKRFGLEVIISDGGSTDRTLSIARRYGDPVVENTDGVRQTIALGRNLGAARARGATLVFMNADTLIGDADEFFTRLEAALQDPAVIAATCRVEVFPDDRRLSDLVFHGFFNWLFSMMNKVGMSMGRGECHVVRRSIFMTAHGYDATIAAGEDYDLFRRLGKLGRIVYFDDMVVYESPRRFRRYGYLGVMGSWFVNYLWVTILHRSVSSHWKPVR